MVSNNKIHAMMVCVGFRPIMLETLPHENAPTMPESVAVTVIKAKAAGCISKEVFANKMAVPLTVATASDSKNHAPRKRRQSFSLRACLIDLQSDLQE